MRIPFFKMFMTSPFEGLQEHAEKVKECAYAFQQAMECHFSPKCKTFEELKETMMPISNFLVFRYLREQDGVLDAVEDTLDWISYRSTKKIPPELKKDFALLVDSVIDSIEMLSTMVAEAREYFNTYSENQRVIVKDIIRKLRHQEHEADKFEDIIKKKVFNMEADAVSIFHLVKLAEIIGAIADHAQNAGDMMRAMLAK